MTNIIIKKTIICIVTYLLFSFIAASFKIFDWHIFIRFVFTFIIFLIIIIRENDFDANNYSI